MEKFSEACVIASTHTVVLVQNAFEAGYLPRRNPFVIYFLFAAALILMSNEFALLYVNAAADQCIRNAITIMAYSAETDPQASRLLYILSTFREVIVQQRDQRARQVQEANQLPPFMKANINPYGTSRTEQQSPLWTDDQRGGGINLPSVTNAGSYGPLAPISSLHTHSSSSGSPLNLNGINLPIPSTSFPPTPSSHNHHLNHSTTRPLEPSLTSPAPPNPLSPHHQQGGSSGSGMQTPTLGSLERQLSFGNIFDLGLLTGGDGMSVSGESNGADEQIDFDALWAWPGGGGVTPVPGGSPRVVAQQQIPSMMSVG